MRDRVWAQIIEVGQAIAPTLLVGSLSPSFDQYLTNSNGLNGQRRRFSRQ